MHRLTTLLRTTIGMKMLVGISGLCWAFFVLTHMAGNLLLFVGPEAYNKYSYKLISNPAIYLAEAGLAFFLLMHVGLALRLTLRNRTARVTAYAASTPTAKKTCFVARTMALSGAVIFVFVVLHLITFKFGTHYSVTYDNVEMRDIYQLVAEKFRDPVYVGWYVLCMGLLGMHLSHAFSASLQSIGLMAANEKCLRRLSVAFGLVVAAGFTAQPLYLFFFGA